MALKGTCHIWINGEGESSTPGASRIVLWESAEAPEKENITDGMTVYLSIDCPGISPMAKAGQIWKASLAADNVTWTKVTGEI